MSIFGLLVFLHIAAMFVAVALAYGPEILFFLAVRTNRAETLRSVMTAAQLGNRIFPIFFTIGAAFGLLAAINGGFNLLAPWLIIAYVIFGILTVIGVAFTGPRMARIAAAVGPAPDGPLPADVVAQVKDSTFLAVLSMDATLLTLLVLDMVVKPFS